MWGSGGNHERDLNQLDREALAANKEPFNLESGVFDIFG